MDLICLWIGRLVLVLGGLICLVIVAATGIDMAIQNAEYIGAFLAFSIARRKAKMEHRA